MTGSLSGPRPPPPGFSPSEAMKSSSNFSHSNESEFQAVNKAVIQALLCGNDIHLTPIKASGGHGGFYVAEVSIINSKTGLQETKKLFLKPFDSCEFNNFDFIQKYCAGKEEGSILKYMPRVYGQATLKVNGNDVNFMVMENLRSDGAKEWTQVADLKMTKGGQYNLNELWATGRTKGILDQKLLIFQGAVAENFLTLHTNPIKRTTNAVKGTEKAFQKNLLKALDKMNQADRIPALKKLGDQLDRLGSLIDNYDSPMGFIGASVFIFASGNEFKIYLADPAHGIAQPWAISLQTLSDEQRKTMYWGGEYDSKGKVVNNQSVTVNAQFKNQKHNNAIAIQAMKNEVDSVTKSLSEKDSPSPLPAQSSLLLQHIKNPGKSSPVKIAKTAQAVLNRHQSTTSSQESDTFSSSSATSSGSSGASPTTSRKWIRPKSPHEQAKTPAPNAATNTKPPANTQKWQWPK